LIYGLLREGNKPIDICSVIGCWSTCPQPYKNEEVASPLFYIVISICAIIDLLLSNRNKSATLKDRIAAPNEKTAPENIVPNIN
jgi:hypothetical protein